MRMLPHVLPVPGPSWGDYPLRPGHDTAAPRRPWRWVGALGHCRQVARAAHVHAEDWHRLEPPARSGALRALRGRLRRLGLEPDATAHALGVVVARAAETLGVTARPTQCMAAAALLDNRMAEMATGEGKTLAIALAAAVAALAGMPVHVATSNDYLAARDAQRMAPLFQALGLRVATMGDTADAITKRAAYRHDIVYTTAKALAFDFLHDRQSAVAENELGRVAERLGGGTPAQPFMRGLCMALLDEADSILLDEAEVPLVLSRTVPQAARRALLWQAVALARQWLEGRDFTVHRADRLVTLTPAGEHRLDDIAAHLEGPWRRPRYRREALLLALTGLHAYHRNQHYLVRDGRIDLLDDVTGRVAEGRVWSRGLHTIVALKERLSPPDETETVAHITFQRFFQRYWRLAGISGTLWEARGELQQVYGAAVVRIPLHRPCRRVEVPARQFATSDAMLDALVRRVRGLHDGGRPVLIGTDSVADSQRVSERLHRHAVPHCVLSALHDADEATIVAQAGQAGTITVATRMAGRGTDIELDAAARAAGGLHVLSCQDNPSRRLDRQLAGRAARHGDPGSTEAWSMAGNSAHGSTSTADKVSVWNLPTWTDMRLWLAPVARRRCAQWSEDRRRAALRRNLLEQDLYWERRLSFAGRSS